MMEFRLAEVVFNGFRALILCISLTSVLPAWASSLAFMEQEAWPLVATTAFSPQELAEVYSFILSQKDIPFRFCEEGCHIRAREVAYRLAQKGLEVASVRIQTTNPDRRLPFRNFVFHEATVVYLEENSRRIPMVIDPAFFPEPVPLSSWARHFSDLSVQEQNFRISFKLTLRRYAAPNEQEKRRQDAEMKFYQRLESLKAEGRMKDAGEILKARACLAIFGG